MDLKQPKMSTTKPGSPSPNGAPGISVAIDTETLELLEAWAREDATDDPEKLRAAQDELDDFKKAMNMNRAGARAVFPNVT